MKKMLHYLQLKVLFIVSWLKKKKEKLQKNVALFVILKKMLVAPPQKKSMTILSTISTKSTVLV